MAQLTRMDVQWSLLSARYGEPWCLGRKIVERSFRPASLVAYHTLQGTRSRVRSAHLLQNPQESGRHELSCKDFFSLLICSISRLSIIIHTASLFQFSKPNKCLP